MRAATGDDAAALQAALMMRSRDDATWAVLQQRYDEVVHLSDQVTKLDALRAADVESRMEEESRRLTSETGGLLLIALID